MSVTFCCDFLVTRDDQRQQHLSLRLLWVDFTAAGSRGAMFTEDPSVTTGRDFIFLPPWFWL
jgi:hypothetical protein